jgi:excisionase family DNA binding protein
LEHHLLYTVNQAAQRMGVGERMVRRLIAERRIEFVKVGKHVRISEVAIQHFLQAGTVAKQS